MTRITDMHGDLQAESSVRLFMFSSGRGHIVAAQLQAALLPIEWNGMEWTRPLSGIQQTHVHACVCCKQKKKFEKILP